MNKREAKGWVYRRVALVVEAARNAGWPYELCGLTARTPVGLSYPLMNEDGHLTADGERVEQALNELVAELRRRGDG
jgi:hypothetical protein